MFKLKRIIITSMIALIGLTGCSGTKSATVNKEDAKQEVAATKEATVEQSSKPEETQAEYKGINVVKSSDTNIVVSVPNPEEVTGAETIDIVIHECKDSSVLCFCSDIEEEPTYDFSWLGLGDMHIINSVVGNVTGSGETAQLVADSTFENEICYTGGIYDESTGFKGE
ncbi:MAG: hypothetical protein K6G65_06000 [Lachnospiraceae bacterium]|nr:hypothetical protein [Lachnospiraceae bacterium]